MFINGCPLCTQPASWSWYKPFCKASVGQRICLRGFGPLSRLQKVAIRSLAGPPHSRIQQFYIVTRNWSGRWGGAIRRLSVLGEAGHTSPQAQPLSLERRGPRAKHLLVWKLLGTHLGPTGDTNEPHTSPAKVPSGQALPHHLTAPFCHYYSLRIWSIICTEGQSGIC